MPLLPLVPLGACGRAGFDEVKLDAAPPDAPPPPTLSCTSAPRFAIGTGVKQLAATATDTGYAVVTYDSTNNVTASTYTFASDPATGLQASTETTQIDTNATGTLGAYSHGGNVYVEVETMSGGQSGTDAIDLDSKLAPLNPKEFAAGIHAQTGMGAYNSEGTGVYLAQAADSSVTGALSINNSTTLGPEIPLLDKNTGANQPSVVGNGTQFTVAWGSQSTIYAQVFDDQLAPAGAPQTISTMPTNQAENARVAYAQAAGRYLFVWTGKDPDNMFNDGVWFSLRDQNLHEIRQMKIATVGVWPSVAAGADSFLVGWETNVTPYQMVAARVSFDTGAITPVGVPGTGTTAGWDLVTLNGQAAAVWAEANGQGPNLWLDPLCQ
jgi:hypothetical protein